MSDTPLTKNENAELLLELLRSQYADVIEINQRFRNAGGLTLAVSGSMLSLFASTVENIGIAAALLVLVATGLVILQGILTAMLWSSYKIRFPLNAEEAYSGHKRYHVGPPRDIVLENLTKNFLIATKAETEQSFKAAKLCNACICFCVATFPTLSVAFLVSKLS